MSNSGLKRNLDEKFYTKIDIAKRCVIDFIQHINPTINSTIIEPSAGNGSFSNALRGLFKNVTAIDIHKELDYVIQQDYLTYEPARDNDIHVIGNPPFGRQSSLVKRFIRHSAKFANSISFILPKSFRKLSVQRIFPLDYHLIYELEIPKKSFYIAETGDDHDVPCIFQVWKRCDTYRTVPERPEPLNFEFLKYGDVTTDFAIRRVGGTAGRLNRKWQDCSPSTHYYIRLNGGDVERFIELYDESVFETDNTVGPRSISKSELIHVINAIKI